MITDEQRRRYSLHDHLRYELRLQAHVCVKCRVQLAEDYHYVLCPACRERNNAAMRERAARRREAGICVSCGAAPAEAPSTYCDACKAYLRAARRGESKRRRRA